MSRPRPVAGSSFARRCVALLAPRVPAFRLLPRLMTFAVAATTPTQPTVPQTVPIVILGTDAVLAAAAGNAGAARARLSARRIRERRSRELGRRAHRRRRAATTPAVRQRSGDSVQLSDRRAPTAHGRRRSASRDAPARAAAGRRRALCERALADRRARESRTSAPVPARSTIRSTFACRPTRSSRMLAERDIVLDDQPRVFESIIPPDRRRFRSQPGGVPTAEALWTEFGARTLVELDGEDFVTEVAQHLLTGKNVLIDAATRLGCACSGAIAGVAVKDARAGVVTLEPPRATSPVVEERTPIDLDLPVPAVSRTPVDVVAVSVARPVQALAATAPSSAHTGAQQRRRHWRAIASVRCAAWQPSLSQERQRARVGRRRRAPCWVRCPSRATSKASRCRGPTSRDAGRRHGRSKQSCRTTHPSPTQAQRSARPAGRTTVETTRPSSDAAIALPAISGSSTPGSASSATATSGASAMVGMPSLAERTRYEPPAPMPSVAPEPITFFDAPRPTPVSTPREPRAAVSSADATSERPRASTRPRPAVAVERAEDSTTPNRRWFVRRDRRRNCARHSRGHDQRRRRHQPDASLQRRRRDVGGPRRRRRPRSPSYSSLIARREPRARRRPPAPPCRTGSQDPRSRSRERFVVRANRLVHRRKRHVRVAVVLVRDVDQVAEPRTRLEDPAGEVSARSTCMQRAVRPLRASAFGNVARRAPSRARR